MRDVILFAWRRPTPPFFVGGAEVSRHLLARQFVQAGYRVVYVGSFERVDRPGESQLEAAARELEGRGIGVQQPSGGGLAYAIDGIECLSTAQARVANEVFRAVELYRPLRVFLTQEGAGNLAHDLRVECHVVGELHSVSAVGFDVLRGCPQSLVAVSRFVAQRCAAETGRSAEVVYPVFEAARETGGGRTNEGAVLFVNPVREKGGDLLDVIAKMMPERQFIGVEGWYPVRRTGRPRNVEIVARQWSLEGFYKQASVLLVPSVVEEAYGRVITEAGLHGVPAVASDRGGIGEAVGDGGVLLTSYEAQDWVRAVRFVLEEKAFSGFSSRALRYSREMAGGSRVEALRACGVL